MQWSTRGTLKLGNQGEGVMDEQIAPERSAVGYALQAMRKKGIRACTVCGKEMEGTARRKYCSHTCTIRAYRQRVRERHGHKS